MQPSCGRAATIAAGILAVSAVGALFLDDLGEIVEVVGAIGGFGLFVLPSVVYCNLAHAATEPVVWRRFLCWAGLVGFIGLAVAILNAVLVVVNLSTGRDGGGPDPCGPPPAV